MTAACHVRSEEFAPDVRHTSVGSHWLYDGDNRLDATSYALGAMAAIDAVQSCRAPKKRFAELCSRIWHPVQSIRRSEFKRIYTDERHGVPFVSSRDMFFLPLRPERFLSRLIPKLHILMVSKGDLLLSRSGTVGNVLYVNQRLAACAITDHAIRVHPKSVASGYLYAFMACPTGQQIILKGIYGATVDELEPDHFADALVPLVNADLRRRISRGIVRAYTLRDEANEMFDRADRVLHEVLGISPFTEDDIQYLEGADKVRAFQISSDSLDDRFDATHHVPLVSSVVAKLEAGRYPLYRLGDTDSEIVQPPRFKRVYVAPGRGVPFFQPSYIPTFRPQEVKHISKLANASVLPDCMLERDSVIITRSGTAGRCCLVTEPMTMFAGSDDMIRVVTRQNVDPGFLTAFLMSPYGRHQVLKYLYGGVVDHVNVPHVAAVLIPEANERDQIAVGDLVRLACQKKDQANALEERSVALMESAIRNEG